MISVPRPITTAPPQESNPKNTTASSTIRRTFTDGVTKVLEEARDHAKNHNGRLTDNEANAYKARLDAAARMDKEVLRKALAKEIYGDEEAAVECEASIRQLEESREQCLARLKRLREKELEVDLDD